MKARNKRLWNAPAAAAHGEIYFIALLFSGNEKLNSLPVRRTYSDRATRSITARFILAKFRRAIRENENPNLIAIH